MCMTAHLTVLKYKKGFFPSKMLNKFNKLDLLTYFTKGWKTFCHLVQLFLGNTQRIRFPWPLSTTRTQPFPSSHYITGLAVCFGLQWRQVLLRHKYIVGSFHVFGCVLFGIPSDILNVFIVSSCNSTALAKCFEDSCWMCSLVSHCSFMQILHLTLIFPA